VRAQGAIGLHALPAGAVALAAEEAVCILVGALHVGRRSGRAEIVRHDQAILRHEGQPFERVARGTPAHRQVPGV
jgi:hypothetical protein